MIDALQSLSALSTARGLGVSALDTTTSSDAASAAGGAGAATGTSFADTLGNMASGMVGDLRNAEKVSFQGLQGQASTRQVVDAVMTAQQSLQTALAIRDKIVSAYLDISRMTI